MKSVVAEIRLVVWLYYPLSACWGRRECALVLAGHCVQMTRHGPHCWLQHAGCSARVTARCWALLCRSTQARYDRSSWPVDVESTPGSSKSWGRTDPLRVDGRCPVFMPALEGYLVVFEGLRALSCAVNRGLCDLPKRADARRVLC